MGYVDKWDVVLMGGMIGSLFSLLQFFVSPIIGRASDRLGRRKVLLYTMVTPIYLSDIMNMDSNRLLVL